ncbi:MAG: lytic transglycosylase domain-containing protein [Candidatus Eremiobacter antarcticus]
MMIPRLGLLLLIIGSATVAGCSGGGFLPLVSGPHSMDAARLNAIVSEQSRARGVPQSLVQAVIAQESGGDPSAISSAGAMGLMQLMPGTAAAYGVVNAFDPAANVAGGVAYLHDLLQRYHGDVSLALAAYNAGSGAVQKYGGIPPYAETRAYVDSINAMYRSAPKR